MQGTGQSNGEANGRPDAAVPGEPSAIGWPATDDTPEEATNGAPAAVHLQSGSGWAESPTGANGVVGAPPSPEVSVPGTLDQPSVEQPAVAGQPVAADQPSAGQPGAAQPGDGSPGVGQPGVGQPGVGQPGDGQVGVGPLVPQWPTAESPQSSPLAEPGPHAPTVPGVASGEQWQPPSAQGWPASDTGEADQQWLGQLRDQGDQAQQPQWPGQAEPQWPGQAEPQWPGQAEPQWPGQAEPQWPDQTAPQWPGQEQQQWPAQEQATQWPGQADQQWPAPEQPQQWPPAEQAQQWPPAEQPWAGQQQWPAAGQPQWPAQQPQPWPAPEQQWPQHGQWPAQQQWPGQEQPPQEQQQWSAPEQQWPAQQPQPQQPQQWSAPEQPQPWPAAERPQQWPPQEWPPQEAHPPLSGQPVPGQPVPGQPGPDQPVPGQPAPGQPVPDQPVTGYPVSGQPVSGYPVSGYPESGQPVPGQPVSGQPTSGYPVPGQPVSGQPMPGQHAPGQPAPGQQTPPPAAHDLQRPPDHYSYRPAPDAAAERRQPPGPGSPPPGPGPQQPGPGPQPQPEWRGGAPHHSFDQPAVPPTAEEFAARRAHRPRPPEPTMGMPALIRRVTFGTVSPALSKREIDFRDAVSKVRRNFGGLRQVTVVNPKGGAGKTVAVLMTAMTFGQNRGGYVLAWDNNETQGTLGMRSQQDYHVHTVRDVLRALPGFQHSGKVGDLTPYVRSQGEAMFDVLASDESATAGEMLTAEAFKNIREVVSRFYKLIVVDTGNNVRAENWQAAIDATDQLVITMSARGDSAETAARMLDHLDQTGRHELVRRAVSVVAMPANRKDVDLEAIQRHFAARTRAVLLAPYERLLDTGEPIRYGELSSRTTNAWLRIAAAIAEGL